MLKLRLFRTVLLLDLVWFTFSKDLIGEQFDIYKKIIETGKQQPSNAFTAEDLKQILHLHEDDLVCSDACDKFVQSFVGDSSLHFFETVIRDIYAGQISEDPFYPQEIHLALTPVPTSMKVMWVTFQGLENPFCEFVDVNEADWSAATKSMATISTYSVPQKWWPVFTGQIYETDMTELIPSKSYKYRVGGWDVVNATMQYSEVFTFKAAPSKDPNQKTVVAAFGDQGTFELLGFAVARKMTEVQKETPFDFVYVAGDLSYAGLSSSFKPLNISSGDEFSNIWDLTLIQNQPISAVTPWMVGAGNHDSFYNWTAFTSRYKMPATPDLSTPSQGNLWYAFTHGNVRWISLSSEHDMGEGSVQRLFLEKALAAAVADRATVPWVVVGLHRPVYSSSSGQNWRYRDLLEPLLLAHDVDLVIAGHWHCYERIHPVQGLEVTVYPSKGRTSEDRLMDVYHATGKGPVYVVQGNAGAMQAETWMQPQPEWSAVRMAEGISPPNRTSFSSSSSAEVEEAARDGGHVLPTTYTDTFGFGLITFVNSTHLFYHSTPVTGRKDDKFWIVKRDGTL